MILLHRLRATNFKQIEGIDLTFPTSGTLLIEGQNEAGKSTLFEAIFYALYGKVPGDGDVISAIRYGCETMEVTLDYSIEGRLFCVTRKQGQRATASMTFPSADGQIERTVTVSGVNKQIIDEMSLTPQGLLNTCFVEQKKLEHLESLNPSQRQTAINELVNLSAFDRIEKGFPSKADEDRKENAAKVRWNIAQHDSRFAALQSTLHQWVPLQAVARLDEVHAEQEECRHKRRDLVQWQEAVVSVITLKERQAWLADKVAPALSLWQAASDTETAASHAVEQTKNAQKQLPSLEGEAVRLGTLRDRLTLFLTLQSEEARHREWEAEQATARAEVARRTTVLAEAKRGWDDAQNALSAAEQYHALNEWTRAKTEVETALNPAPDPRLPPLITAVDAAKTACETAKSNADAAETAARDAEKNADAVNTRCHAEITRLQNAQDDAENPASIPAAVDTPPAASPSAVGFGLVVLGAVLMVVALLTRQWVLLGAAAVMGAGGVGLITRPSKAHREALRRYQEREAKQAEKRQAELRPAREALRAEIDRLNKEIDQARLAARTAQETAGARVKAHTETLNRLADAERDLADYRVQNDRSGRLPGLRDALNRAEQSVQTLNLVPLPQTFDEARERAGTVPPLPVADLRRKVTEAQAAHGNAQALVSEAERRMVPYAPRHEFSNEEKAAALLAPQTLHEAGFTLSPEPLADAVKNAERAKDDAQRLADSLPACEAALSRAVSNSNEQKSAFHRSLVRPSDALFPKLQTTDALQTPADAGTLLDQISSDLRERAAQQEPALVVLSLDALRRENDTLSQSAGALTRELAGLTTDETVPRQTLMLTGDTLLAELLPDLHKRYPDVNRHTAADWHEKIKITQAEAQHNRSRRSTLAESALITDAVLEVAVEKSAYDVCLFERAVNRSAKTILSRTRHAILDRVMPGTLVITKRILPLLTDNRYRDVRWDISSNLIEVMDARKGDWAMKKVFSGGTRDQISLALRLSFVLATLPNTKATRPGWLFLDEPLSSFDAARSESLIKLLTKGTLIRPQFPQIFLISHGAAADPSRFDYHLLMEGGVISPSSRLPVA